MANTEAFENHAAAYENWFETHRWAYLSELKAVRALLPQEGEGIEIGVGSGRFAAALGIQYGVEPAGAMRVLAEARGIEVVDAQAEALPFPAEMFDYALMVTTVCFLDDIEKAFSETYRILKRGGAFVVAIIDRTSPLGQQYERHKEASVFYRGAHFHSADEVAGIMRSTGFEDLAFRQTLFGDPADMEAPDEIRDAYGEGAFVVIGGMKSR